MSYLSTKKLLAGVATATVLALASPTAAYAATNEQVFAAAQAGISYLADNQNENGGISGALGGESDWTTIAVTAGGHNAFAFKNGSGDSIVDFLKTDVPSDATDVARRILAIASIKEDSTNFGGIDYDALLATYHNNDQIGEVTDLNDDMWGVIAAGASGDSNLLEMAQDGLNYFIANQEADGGFSYTTIPCDWDFCTDSDSNNTAVAIIAMGVAMELGLTNPNLEAALTNALTYLFGTQQPDGGFGSNAFGPSDGSSTAWALMVLNVIGEPVADKAAAARDWLLANQNPDGGFHYGAWGLNDSDTFTTSNAVIALLGTTWLLDPAPLQAPAPDPVDVITSSTPTTPQPTATKPATTSTGQVLAAETTAQTDSSQAAESAPIKDEPKDKTTPAAKVNSSTNRYVIYAAIALALIGLGWYLFQPKKA